ncbi:MAG TPA: hypothetical protein VD994_00250 [Prosthecobacter sp.]|nr:hypothetical protein [Prosthecobacter sp.]
MSLLSEDRVPFRLPSTGGALKPETDLFTFSGSVGPNGENRREDVIKAQMLLAQTGDFKSPFDIPTGWPSNDLYQSIKTFQKRHGKQPDGTLLPLPPGGVDENGVGESLYALRSELGEQLTGEKAPTPSQVDAHYENEARFRNTAAGEEELMPAEPLPELKMSVGESAHGQQPSPLPIHNRSVTGQQEAYLRQNDILPQFYPEGGLIRRGGGGGPRGPQPTPKVNPRRPDAPDGIPQPSNMRAPNTEQLPGRIHTGDALARPPAVPGTSSHDAASADFDQARTPDPAQPEEDKVERDNPPRRGRIVIAADGKELNIPPLEPWIEDLKGQKRDFAETFHDQLAVEMLHHHGPRGSELTQQQLKDVVDACTAAAVEMFPDFEVTHVAGTYDKAGNPLSEEQMWIYDKDGNRLPSGFRRPDFSIRLARHVAFMLRGNSYDSYADGRPKPREQSAKDDIEAMSPDDPFVMIRKLKQNASQEAVRAEADKICREALTKVKAKLDKNGEWDQPQPERPATYQGPANKQEAVRKQQQLNQQPRPRQSIRK